MLTIRGRAGTGTRGVVRSAVLVLVCAALWVLVESVRAAPTGAVSQPGVTVSESALSVQQGATGSFTVVLDKQPTAGVSFTVFPRNASVALVSTPDGSHPAYANPANSTFIRFGAADWSTPKTVRVHGQSVGEAEIELFMFTSDPAYENVAVPSVSATVWAGTVPPTTVPPKPTVTVSAGSGVTEGSAASFTLTASPAPASAIDVSVAVTQSGSFVTTGTRTVSVGTSGTATLAVSTTDDSVDEPDGSVTATVQAGSSYTVGSPAAATVTIADDDPPEPTVTTADDDGPPVVTITAGPSVTEGEAATFTLTASPAPPLKIVRGSKIDLLVLVGITQNGSFASTRSRSVAIGTSGTATLSISTTDDSTDEPDGSVTATVRGPSCCYKVGNPAAATVTVVDNDGPPVVTITAGPSVAEGEAAAFTLTVSPKPASAISVPVAITQNGSFATTGTRTVSVGTSGKATLSVSTTDDSTDEPDGSVTATVQAGASYAVGGTGAATVTVADNDGSPFVIVTPADMWVSERLSEQMHPLRALADGDAADVEALRRIEAKEISLPFRAGSRYRGIGLKPYNDLCLQLGTDPGDGQTVTVTVPLPRALGFAKSLKTTPPLTGASSVTNNYSAGFKFTGGSSGNWGSQQCVVVRALRDADMADGTGTVTMKVDYNGPLPDVSLNYTVYDDVWAHMTVNPGRLALTEGGSAKTYSIERRYPWFWDLITPVAIAPKVACADDGDGDDDGDGEMDEYCDTSLITVSSSTYTFAFDSNGPEPPCGGWEWACSDPITVTPGTDADYLDTELFIEHTVTGFLGYTGPFYLPVTLKEPVGLVQAFPSSRHLFDGAGSGTTNDLSDTFNVRLRADPGADVTVAVDCTSAKLSCTSTSLTFTHGSAGNWGTYQPVTVTPTHDADSADDTVTITLTPSGSAMSKPTSVTVTITDDD